MDEFDTPRHRYTTQNLPRILDDGSIDDLVREGLRPGDRYVTSDGDVDTFDPREHYYGGDIPDDLLTDNSGGYGEIQ
jgi:hypothetical protein